jgi:PAS domain S-box-containing protein
MARSLFFTNHLKVLSALAERPDLRLRDIAREVGITERATQRIITELINEGYLARTRVGARNHYAVKYDAPLPDARQTGQTAAQAIGLLTGTEPLVDPAALSGPDGPQRSTATGDYLREAVFAAAPAGIAVADADGRLRAVNPAFCELLGRSQNELLGRSFREFTHPDDIAPDHERQELLTGERCERAREKRYIRVDGTVTWVKVHMAAIADPASGEPLVVAHVTDVSERRRQDQALAEAEERFRSAFDNAPIGMALVAPDGRWLKVNHAVCELTGYSETAMLVRSFQDITHPDDLDTDLAYVEDVLAGRRRTYQMEKRYYHAHGKLIWVMLSVSLVRDDCGKPLYFVSQIEDITERKRREHALKRQAEQVAIIAATGPLTQATSHPD